MREIIKEYGLLLIGCAGGFITISLINSAFFGAGDAFARMAGYWMGHYF